MSGYGRGAEIVSGQAYGTMPSASPLRWPKKEPALSASPHSREANQCHHS
jgi:hypothetical protein